MFTINIRPNIKEFERSLNDFAWKQLPFATAQAINALAAVAVEAERKNEEKVLDRPKPFTENAIRIKKANKKSLEAVVWMMDKTATYLEPYEAGGKNVLNSKALLKPVDAKAILDQYGNLPRNYLQSLKGRSDIFIGPVKTKVGIVNGVWQRSLEAGARAQVVKVRKDGTVRIGKTGRSINSSGKLRLLVKFEDAHPVRQRLHWFEVGQRAVQANFKREMGRALARAIASAK